MTKSTVRAAALARRAEAATVCPQGIGAALASYLLPLEPSFPPDAVVAGYWPMRGEADPLPTLAALHAAGRRLALPVVMDRGQPLVFRAWTPGAALESGPWGTRHPPASADTVRPGVLLVPLAAFDRRGGRLGYGGGFYDRSLAALDAAPEGPVVAIGLAWAVQEVEPLPVEPHDRFLNLVVTEHGVLRCLPPGGRTLMEARR